MNTETEEKIVNAFFNKRSCDRLMYELKSKAKRRHFFDRLAHTCEDYIDIRTIVQKSDRLIAADVIKKALGKTVCYVMACNSALDGTFVSIDNAITELWGCGSPFLLYSAVYDVLHLEAEYDFDVHPSYILKLSTRP